jgi:modulator of FtsH protease HflK
MAWNEPDKEQEKERDPWSGRKRQEEGPPNLDELFNRFFKRAFKGNTPLSNGVQSMHPKKIIGGLVFGGLLIWILSGLFIVQPAEEAAILRLGRYVRTVGDGPHWIPRFFETAIIRNTKQIEKFSYSAQMLTKETNIVSIGITVQYRISDLKDYLFTNKDPEETLFQASASALRQVVGHTDLDSIMTTGRAEVRQRTQQILENILTKYHIGVEIKDVTLQSARAPEPVKEAFNEAIKAQEIEQKYINEAQAYRSAVLPKAKGEARRMVADAEAYSDQVILKAEGDVARFNALLPQYLLAPKVMRDRMYLDAIEAVLEKTSKILVDTKTGNNLLYLPLDRLLEKADTKKIAALSTETPTLTENRRESDTKPADLAEGETDNTDEMANLPIKLEKSPDSRSRYDQAREQDRETYRGREEE